MYRVGVMRPAIYGRPQVADAPRVRARDTASRCRRENTLEQQIACVEADGWELLE